LTPQEAQSSAPGKPLVEITHQYVDPGRVGGIELMLDSVGKSLRLRRSLSGSQTEMGRSDVDIESFQVKAHVQSAARFTAAEAEVLARYVDNREAAEQGVAVLPGIAVERNSMNGFPGPIFA